MDPEIEKAIKYSEVPILTDISPDIFCHEIQPQRRPVVLRGLNLGECTDKWSSINYLLDITEDKQG
jgi:hypothetical protein